MRNEKGQFVKGAKFSKEFREKMGNSRRGVPLSEEHKKKISRTEKGKIVSKETREKMSLFRKGKPSNNKGKKFSEHARKNMSIARKKQFADKTKHPRWKGGISAEPKYFVNKARERRIKKQGNGGNHTQGEWETLKAQYNWTCLRCKKVEPKIQLTRDHIIPISKGGSDNIENIQPLCRSCNAIKHTNIEKYVV